jgi:3-dehydroquinate synthase
VTTRLTVSAASGPYDVVIGTGLLSSAAELCSQAVLGRHALIVADEQVATTHARVVLQSLEQAQWSVEMTTMVACESHKRMSTVESIWQAALAHRMDRHSVMIAVGGGIIGDVAGFAGASFLRGIDVIQIPTTLLAMADASVGGKTGVNVPLPGGDRVGKNLAGAFWPPKLVLADPATLATLPPRDLVCGLAECIKHGVLSDPKLLELIQNDAQALIQAEAQAIDRVLAHAVAVKIGVVASDEREDGTRMLLNLGHTFAHVIEPVASLDLRHGEAVAIGLMAAFHCSVQLGLVQDSYATRVQSLLESVSLPVHLSKAVSVDQLMDSMQFDKKVANGVVRLVLPTTSGALIRDDVSDDVVRSAWASVLPPIC